MTVYCALLRAVNVGGTGKLPMADLRALCDAAGFAQVQTYIASGNVVFTFAGLADDARALLQAKLSAYAGKAAAVFIRDLPQMQAILQGNPFAAEPGNRVAVTFLDVAWTPRPLKHRRAEQVIAAAHEIYVHYPSGIGASRLVIPGAEQGTVRNINTVTKIAEMMGKTPA